MHGFPYIPASIGAECLLFPTRWFTRSLQNHKRELSAISQIERLKRGGRLLWVVTTKKADYDAARTLIEGITSEAGRKGCLFVCTSIDRDSPAVNSLKLNGFAQIGWERAWLWKKNAQIKHRQLTSCWRKTKATDLFSIEQLQNKILSPAEKWITPSVHQSPPAYTLVIDGVIEGFAHLQSHNKTAIIIPSYSQSIPLPNHCTESLLQSIPDYYLYLYILLRGRGTAPESTMLEHYKCASGTRFRMVKHLVVRSEAREAEMNHLTNGSTTDALTTISKSNVFKDKI